MNKIENIATAPNNEKIQFNDVTLRDGEQAPGCAMTLDQKVRIARDLCDLNIDGIEAGFAANQNGGYDSVKAIADEYGSSGPIISSLARARREDIDAADNATKKAKNRGVVASPLSGKPPLNYDAVWLSGI